MKYCAYCGKALDEDMLFCPKCGKKQASLEFEETAKGTESSSDKVKGRENEEKNTQNRVDAYTPSNAEPNNRETKFKKTSNLLIIISVITAAVIIVAITLIVLLHGPRTVSAQSETVIMTPIITETPNTTSTPAQTHEPTEGPFTIVGNADAIEKISKSVVKLTCYDEFGIEYASGSGFFAFEPDLIVTNYHIIEGNVKSIIASSDEEEFEIEYVVNYNERYDLALLHVSTSEEESKDADYKPLIIGDSFALKVSDHITAIGVPLGISKTVSDGIISGFYEDNGVKLIQFTAPISHGSSGGVLLNDSGEVIGITSASFSDGQNFNLTVPSSYISILYNAQPQHRTITSFHDEQEHYYSTEYCLKYLPDNEYIRHGKMIKLYGYVSSAFKLNSDIQKDFWAYLTYDSKYINGFYGYYGYTEKGSSDFNCYSNGKKITNRVDDIWVENNNEGIKSCFNLTSISVVEKTVNTIDYEQFVPGALLLITGEIYEVVSDEYPGKTGLQIEAVDVEAIQ